MTGGTIKTGTIGGGKNTSDNSKVGYARAYISGGDISGQFLLKGKLPEGANTEQQKNDRCEFIMTGGLIHDVSADDTSYIYKDNDKNIYRIRATNGGAVWMDDQYGVVTISGGSIKDCDAKSGGAVYMTGGTFTLTGSGTIENCTATGGDDADKDGRGGAVYLGGGRAIVGIDRKLNNDKVETLSYYGLIKEDNTITMNNNQVTVPLKTKDYTLAKDDVKSLKCGISGCSATYGGALYVSGGDGSNNVLDSDKEYNEDESTKNNTIDPSKYNIYISAGKIDNNTADKNGGGICLNNGHILMDGGVISNNKANDGSGGGLYLSSMAREDARVRIRSGSIINNKALSTSSDVTSGGGAIAVEGQENSTQTLKVTIGVNENHYECVNDGFEDKENKADCDHINDGTLTDDKCPIIQGNTSLRTGGAIHIKGGKNTILNIYCIEESDNSAENDKDGEYRQSDFLMVEGGTVTITTGDKKSNSDADEGHSKITGSIHIVGGSLDIYGHMKNPEINAVITVDINDSNDHFEDHRVHINKDGDIIYWVHYYENFWDGISYNEDEDGTKVKSRTGRYRAIPIYKDDNYNHTIISSLFTREGYKIEGWNTYSEGEGNWYATGDNYQFDNDESAGRIRNIQVHYEEVAYDDELSNSSEEYYIKTDSYNYEKINNSEIANYKYEKIYKAVSDLKKSDDANDDDRLTTLVLYAIWDQESYNIHYDANAEKYTGSMNDQVCLFGKEITLSQNKFKVDGYEFKEWNTKKDGTGVSYTDEQAIKYSENILSKVGSGNTVTLYAQWGAHSSHNLVYTVFDGEASDDPDPDNTGNGDNSGTDTDTDNKDETAKTHSDTQTIKETCSDCSHVAYATINGVTREYNAKENLATVTYSQGWMGGELEITYDMLPDSEWDEKDKIDDLWKTEKNQVPLHVGIYDASISVSYNVTKTDEDGKEENSTVIVTATARYKITCAKWETPAAPTVNAIYTENQPNRFEFTTPKNSEKTDIEKYSDDTTLIKKYMYAMSTPNDITSTTTGIVYSEEYNDEKFVVENSYHGYCYFAVYQVADRDHMQSDISESYAYYTNNGVIMYIIPDEGIEVFLEKEIEVEKNSLYNPVFTVDLKEGYHYRNYNDASEIVLTNTNGETVSNIENNNAIVTSQEDKEKENAVEKHKSDTSHTYIIRGLGNIAVSAKTVTIYVKGAAKDATLTAKVIDGQKFVDFNGDDNTTISVDSAFTAQFTVKDFIPDEYNCPKLTFERALPKDTTLIWRDMTKNMYWYYVVTDESGDREMSLNKFHKMGTRQDDNSSGYNYDININYSNDFIYQFIVDFSQTDTHMEEGSMALDLTLEPSENSKAPKIPRENDAKVSGNSTSQSSTSTTVTTEHQLSINLKKIAEFILNTVDGGIKDLSGTLTTKYTKSEGAASIWNGRVMSLVLTAPDNVPADLYITAKFKDTTMTIYSNANKQFIIPMEGITFNKSWDNEDIMITLHSAMLPKNNGSYTFDAQWYVSSSMSTTSPLNGYLDKHTGVKSDGATNAETKITFNYTDSNPSLKIESKNHIYKIGDTLEADIKYLDIPSDATISAVLQLKENDEYKDTNVVISTINTNNWKISTNDTYKYKYNLSQSLSPGSYRLMVTVSRSVEHDDGVVGTENILQVPYYFILLNSN